MTKWALVFGGSRYYLATVLFAMIRWNWCWAQLSHCVTKPPESDQSVGSLLAVGANTYIVVIDYRFLKSGIWWDQIEIFTKIQVFYSSRNNNNNNCNINIRNLIGWPRKLVTSHENNKQTNRLLTMADGDILNENFALDLTNSVSCLQPRRLYWLGYWPLRW